MSNLFKEITASIFPVFINRKGDEKRPIVFSGTGFFMEHNSKTIFVTAGHVGLRYDRHNKDVLLLPEYLGNGEDHFVYITGEGRIMKDYDFTFYAIDERTLLSFKREPKSILLYEKELEPYTDIYTFGFPGTYCTSQRADMNFLFQKGYICRLVKKDKFAGLIPRPFEKNYLLNFRGFPGLSGAPIMIDDNGITKVAGILYGETELDFTKPPIEVDEKLMPKNKMPIGEDEDIVRIKGIFGVASDHEPLLAALRCLEKIEKKGE